MSKKTFKTSFNDILGSDKNIETSKIKIPKQELTKATFIIRCDQHDKMRAISYLERKMIKDVLQEALTLFINKYESENEPINLPKK